MRRRTLAAWDARRVARRVAACAVRVGGPSSLAIGVLPDRLTSGGVGGSAGGPNTLENVLTLCTQHHRLVHEGVLAIEGVPGRGLVVRHSGGTLYGATHAVGSDGVA